MGVTVLSEFNSLPKNLRCSYRLQENSFKARERNIPRLSSPKVYLGEKMEKLPHPRKTFMFKQVIVARADLKMSPGKLAVQVAHGAIAAAEKTREKNREWLEKWLKEGQKKVLVKVNDENELLALYEKVRGTGLVGELIQDAGLTELPPGTTTVLAIGPAPNELIDKLTGNLPLF
jgi:PTH2 family peptidyl-tRNA hydrolase